MSIVITDRGHSGVSQVSGVNPDPATGNVDLSKAFARSGLPSYAPAGLLNRYDQGRFAYNWKASNTRKLKAGLGKAAAGSIVNHLILGDSLSDGYNGTGMDQLHAWPLIYRDALGIKVAGEGFVRGGGNAPASDPRWVYSGSHTSTAVGWATVTGQNNYVTLTTTQPCTNIDVWYSDASGTFTASVDGAVSGSNFVTVAPGGTFTWKKISFSGLTLKNHTLVLKLTGATGSLAFKGANCYNAAGGLLVHNMAEYGYAVTDYTDASTWNKTEFILEQVLPPSSISTVFCALGVNDIVNRSRTIAQVTADLTTIRNRFPNADFILILQHQSGAASGANWDSFAAAMYSLADTLDVPLVNIYDLVGSYTIANANGLLGDNTHLTRAGWEIWGRTVAANVTGTDQSVDYSQTYARKALTRFAAAALTREHRNERRLGALSTATVTNDATNDATLSTYYVQPGYYYAAAQAMTPADQAALKFDPGQDVFLWGSKASAVGWTYANTPVYQGSAVRRNRIATDAPKLQVGLWMYQSGMAYQVFVDDQPVTATPQTCAAAISNLHIDLSSLGGGSHVVEIRTACAIGSIQYAPPYSIWRPSPVPAPRGLIVGDSYLTSMWQNDGTTALANLGPLLMNGIEDYLDIDRVTIDGIGGTGFIARNASGSGAPNNNYADRVLPYVAALNPDFVWIPNGCANDLSNGNTACINAIVSWFQNVRAALPYARLVYAWGHCPANFQASLANMQAIGAGVVSAFAGDPLFYSYDNTGWLFGNGYVSGGVKQGAASSNGQLYVGNDQIHPTIAGGQFLRPRHAEIMGRILRDTDGSLAGLVPNP